MRDAAARHVVINDTDTLKFSPDSTLIVLVDRVDNVGGPPVVTSISVPLVSRILLADDPQPPDSARAIMARIAAGETYETKAVKLLNTYPAANEFINRPASRLPQGAPAAAARAAMDAAPARRGPGASGSRGSQISIGLRSNFFYERRDTHVVTLIVLSRDDTNRVVRSSSGGGSALRTGGSSGAARNVQSMEFSTRTATVSVMRDPGAGHIIVNRRDTLAVPLDSTVILMLDHRGGAGQSPRSASLVVPLVPLALVEDPQPSPAARTALEARFRETGFREGNLTRFLDSIPVVRAFIRQREMPLPAAAMRQSREMGVIADRLMSTDSTPLVDAAALKFLIGGRAPI
jgi:hypothetical protein